MFTFREHNYEVFPIMVTNHSALKSINFFLFKKEDSLTLIDAGFDTEECWEALQNTLGKNNLTLKDLTQIILTHHHIDHVGLVNRIISEHPIPVYAHSASIPRLKRDDDFLNMRVEFFSNLYNEMDCGEAGVRQVDYLKQALQKNRSNKIECDLKEITDNRWMNFDVIHIPGHAPDQIALYARDCGWLFAGDLLLEHISSNALVEPDQFGHRMFTLNDHIHSLKRCLALQSKLVFPGHGNLIEEPHQLINKRLEGIERKSNKIASLIESGISTGNDLAQTYYKDIYKQQFSLVMSEIIGQLDYLEGKGRIKKELVNGVWGYSIA
ncbi:MBL fold metallo-hydrolase [Cytobacillus depressus]|uniref:MBL fold metallo-hydrolase n=1 Tax=Cytobacillus depressus TaxID=1602942 RepID=A0A6L3V5H8_9BACI|nr:MBL fold metallo-hydrolase [Cytobacillus depressus]KAB2330484.1 MBL fold metallo-hydrolase [Cytobacillus depressus]